MCFMSLLPVLSFVSEPLFFSIVCRASVVMQCTSAYERSFPIKVSRVMQVSSCSSRKKCLLPFNFKERSEEHTSELQSLMRISYAVFCLKKKRQTQTQLNKSQTKVLENTI